MPSFTDQTGRRIHLSATPKRIVSLVPSQTELLHYLGLKDEVIGITKFCVHPQEWFQQKTRVGGTKQLHIEKIKALKPDLIIANKEENVKEQIEELVAHFPVWISDVNTLEDASEMIEQVGFITCKEETALSLSKKIKESFAPLASLQPLEKTVYLIWQKPYMTVGGDTFINAMMMAAGFTNMFADEKRYPEVTVELLQQKGCRHLLLSSEPFPFKETHREELQKSLPETKIVLADGEFFSWYGNRMLAAPEYFMALRKELK